MEVEEVSELCASWCLRPARVSALWAPPLPLCVLEVAVEVVLVSRLTSRSLSALVRIAWFLIDLSQAI